MKEHYIDIIMNLLRPLMTTEEAQETREFMEQNCSEYYLSGMVNYSQAAMEEARVALREVQAHVGHDLYAVWARRLGDEHATLRTAAYAIGEEPTNA